MQSKTPESPLMVKSAETLEGNRARAFTVAAAVVWILALGLVITGELLPGRSAPMLWIAAEHINDKLLHFSGYTMLAFIPVLAFRVSTGLMWAVSTVFLGIVLEFAQTLVPGRSFEYGDMLANTLGVITGILLALACRWLRAR